MHFAWGPECNGITSTTLNDTPDIKDAMLQTRTQSAQPSLMALYTGISNSANSGHIHVIYAASCEGARVRNGNESEPPVNIIVSISLPSPSFLSRPRPEVSHTPYCRDISYSPNSRSITRYDRMPCCADVVIGFYLPSGCSEGSDAALHPPCPLHRIGAELEREKERTVILSMDL